MNEQFDPHSGPLRHRDEVDFRPIDNERAPRDAGSGSRSNPYSNGHSPAPAVDFWTVADTIAHRWHWLVIGLILGSAVFFELSWVYIKPKFTATGQLLRYETPATSESLRTTPLSSETFAALLVSPDLLRRVGEQVDPPIPPDRLIKQMKVDPQSESDIVKVFFAAREPGRAVDLVNLYSREAVAFTTELQAKQAAEVAKNYLQSQVRAMDKDITELQEQFRALPASANVTNKLAQISGNLNALNRNLTSPTPPSPLAVKLLHDQLQASFAELNKLTAKYTEEHPAVQQERANFDRLTKQYNEASSVAPGGGFAIGPGGQVQDPAFEIIQGKLRSLEDARIQMVNRQREAELFATNPPGIVRVFAPATLKTVESNHRRIKIGILSVFGGAVGIACSLALLLLTEAVDKRLRTAADVKRVTRLPVLTTLGDLNRMRDESRVQWAFRTWTLLQGRLSQSQNHGLVCGITSSSEGEGRSTWIRLLAEAASLSGFRVLTIATRPSETHVDSSGELTEETLNNCPDMQAAYDHNQAAALTSNVLASPSQVTERLTDPNSQPVVHIPLPGWVWNLERRKQWRSALNQWREIDNLVIFVELPPASVPEAVLLGSNLPNLLWLADSGTAEAAETRSQLETLRHARCNLVGAVLNREFATPLKRLFPRWLTSLLVFLASGVAALQAQQTNLPLLEPAAAASVPVPGAAVPAEVPPRETVSFSVLSSAPRAAWQQRLTLGPGDVLTFGLYGEPTLTRLDVAIGPDGRVSYLEAQDVLAAGLTVDELRAKFDEELSRYRRVPRTIITPTSYRSKKYFVLGKVVQRGVYTLDRPITVIEALARAKGIESGQLENNTVDLADFSRSFLIRGGRRIPLNFERLFQNGDLTQNIQIEPNDYLFFPSANIKQAYVLGEVSLPGPVTYRSDLGVVAAISSRGGFNEKAYKSKVLVVRGSINTPETFIVDVLDVVNGRAPDFRLQPKDIVYVTHRPFYRVEELLDMAVVAFIQAVVATGAGVDGINITIP